MSESDSDLNFKYEWQKLVVNALKELRPAHIPAKIKAANQAMCKRVNDPTTELTEQMALQDALGLLRAFLPSTNQPPSKMQRQNKRQNPLEVRRLRIKTLHRTRKTIQTVIGNKSVQSS